MYYTCVINRSHTFDFETFKIWIHANKTTQQLLNTPIQEQPVVDDNLFQDYDTGYDDYNQEDSVDSEEQREYRRWMQELLTCGSCGDQQPRSHMTIRLSVEKTVVGEQKYIHYVVTAFQGTLTGRAIIWGGIPNMVDYSLFCQTCTGYVYKYFEYMENTKTEMFQSHLDQLRRFVGNDIVNFIISYANVTLVSI